MRNSEPERILCAAIWVDTGKPEPPRRSYTYPATGLVFAGWRHADCFVALEAWVKCLTPAEIDAIDRIGEGQLSGRNQGFITSKGRFVDREEAWQIARAAGQIERDGGSLMSEDLY